MRPELDKIAVRKRMLSSLRRLNPDHREALSHALRSRLSTCEPLRAVQTILAFAPLSSEPMIDHVLDAWRAEGRTVLLPRTLDAPGAMDLVELKSLMCDVPIGAFGIRTPVGPPHDGAPIEAILVPGVAFDHHGGRLGFGGGYYDRLLAEGHGAVTVGVAFECQLEARLPREPHDRGVDFIVTEKELLKTPAGGAPRQW